MRDFLGKDGNWIIAGLAAWATVAVLTLALDIPFLIAAIIALLVFAGLVVLLPPRRPFEGIDIRVIGRERVAFARELLAGARPSHDALVAAAGHVDDKAVAGQLRHMGEIARDVFANVESNPARAGNARRFLSYYLPRAAELAQAYVKIEDRRTPDPQRLGEVARVIGKLEQAFVHYADSLADADLGTMDVELRLIEASLKEDMGR